MRSAAKVVQVRSPEREKLAAVIERHERAKRQLAAIDAAIASAAGTVREARRVLEEGEAAIERAKEDEVRHLIDAALGEAREGPRPLREALASFQTAAEARDAAEA